MKKRLISVLLCIAMTLSLLPVGAMAESQEYTVETEEFVIHYTSDRGAGTIEQVGLDSESRIISSVKLISLPKDSVITSIDFNSSYRCEMYFKSSFGSVNKKPSEKQYATDLNESDGMSTLLEKIVFNEGVSIPMSNVKAFGIRAYDLEYTSRNNTYIVEISTLAAADVTVAQVEGEPGDVISVPVMISGNTGFASFNGCLEYNHDVLELLNYEVSGCLLEGAQVGTKIAFATADNSCVNDGTLFVAKFKVKTNAPNGNYAISLLCDDWYDAINDSDFEYEVTNGLVLVSSSGFFDTDYAVTASEDSTIAVGETAPVVIELEGKRSSTYNAIDMVLTYDASSLSFVKPEIEGIEFDTSTAGQVHVMGYGSDKAIGNILTLPFVGLRPGSSQVSITSAKFDEKENASIQDAPEATIKNANVTITVSAYTVSLGSGAVGETTALPGQDYTFTLTDTQLYDYDLHVIVGGTDITNSVVKADDTYTIPGSLINGNIEVSTGKTGKTFSVALNDDNLDGENHAQYGVDYSFDLTGKNGYTAGVKIKINGTEYNNYGIEGSIYTIPGIDIVGDITVDVTWEKIEIHYTKITIEGNAAGRVTEDLGRWTKSTDGSNIFTSKTEVADSFYFTLYRYALYEYEVSARRADGTPVEIVPHVDSTDYQSFEIEAKDLKEDVILTVNRVATGECEISEYVKLDGKVMYIVTLSGKRDKGTYYFDGKVMPWSDTYNAYCYLLIGESSMTNDDAAQHIDLKLENGTTISSALDVNGTNQIDINDAQFIWNMYNAVYDSFDTISELTFLKADLNGDKKIDILDAQNVMASIR